MIVTDVFSKVCLRTGHLNSSFDPTSVFNESDKVSRKLLKNSFKLFGMITCYVKL